MRFEAAPLQGAFIIHPTRHSDMRGFFQRTFCRETFAAHGLADCSLQASISNNISAGTLRGMHYQAEPYGEEKLVRVSRGAIYDVIVDVRRTSSDYGKHFGVELSAENGIALYIPQGFAHGFLTLTPDVEVAYAMSAAFAPEAARGFRYDDPALAITWPSAVQVVAERDLSWPAFER
jgi:dTDP-4-dehydrorhamnose 3,5-epimerase